MRSFYTPRSEKRKKLLELSVFFALLGSACVKTVRKMLVKLTPAGRQGQAILIRTFPDIFLPSFVFTLQTNGRLLSELRFFSSHDSSKESECVLSLFQYEHEYSYPPDHGFFFAVIRLNYKNCGF